MSRLVFRCAIVAACAFLLLPLAAYAQAADGLLVEISLQGPARSDTPTKVMVTLTNTGTTPISLPHRPDWDPAGGLEIFVNSSVRQAAGHQAAKLPPPANMGSRPTKTDGPTSLKLLPGQSLGFFRLFAPGELFSTPGTYVVSAAYRRAGMTPSLSKKFEVTIK